MTKSNQIPEGRITMGSPGMPDPPAYSIDEIRESVASFEAAAAETRQGESFDSIAAQTYGKQKTPQAEQREAPRPAPQQPEDLSDLVEGINPRDIFAKFNERNPPGAS